MSASATGNELSTSVGWSLAIRVAATDGNLVHVDLGGVRLEYESLGQDAHPPVLLIMGLGQQLVSWPPDFLESLTGQGLRLIRYDQRDTGLSSRMEGRPAMSVMQAYLRRRLGLSAGAPYCLEDLENDAWGLLDALGIGKVHVVGISMGGMVAQLMAGGRPERVLSLTSIMSTSGELHLPGPKPKALMLMARGQPEGTRDELIQYGVHAKKSLAGSKYPTGEDEMAASMARVIDRAWYPSGHRRHAMAVLASPHRRDLLKNLSVPTLVIHGSEDQLVPVQHSRRIAELVPEARLEIIDGLGHDLAPGARAQIAQMIAEHVLAQGSAG